MRKQNQGDIRRAAYFRGHVQGVGFRYTTRRIAAAHSVTGFVRNLPDGKVELVAEGSQKDVDAFVGAVQSEMDAFIDEVDVNDGEATGEFSQFGVRY